MNVKEILLGSKYWVLNKDIVREFGLQTGFILSLLAEADELLSDDDGWFFQKADDLELLSGLSSHLQTKSINKLKSLGILEQMNKGVPMKRYFKLNYECIQKLVFKNFKNCFSNNLKTIYKEHNYKEHINNKSFLQNNISNIKLLDKSIQEFIISLVDKIKLPSILSDQNVSILNTFTRIVNTLGYDICDYIKEYNTYSSLSLQGFISPNTFIRFLINIDEVDNNLIFDHEGKFRTLEEIELNITDK